MFLESLEQMGLNQLILHLGANRLAVHSLKDRPRHLSLPKPPDTRGSAQLPVRLVYRSIDVRPRNLN